MTIQNQSIDENKLQELVGTMVTELGAAAIGALVLVGDRLGLYKALVQAGPATAEELAGRTGTNPRYVQEWLVEPFAGDTLAENPNPVGRAYYAFSTAVCTPVSLSQEVGLALGAQAGEKRLRDVVEEGGFSRFRRATETPFNLILEARL